MAGPNVFPEGYPVLLSGMIHFRLDSARWINAAGIFSVLAAVIAFSALLARDPALSSEVRTLLVLIPLASWVWIKHSILPLSENPYCALSYLALFALLSAWQASGWRAAGWLILGILLSVGAWRVRSVGVSLLGASAFTSLGHPMIRSRRSRLCLVIAVMLALAAGGGWMWHRERGAVAVQDHPGYLLEQQQAAGHAGLPALIASSITLHIRELGEVFLNIPATRFPRLQLAFPVAGLFLLAACLSGFPTLARRFPPLAVYAAAYSAIILVWPFYDPRFWMPLVPILALCAWYACERWHAVLVVRLGIAAYAAVFLALGFLALGISTRLSFSDQRFPDLYGDGTLRDSYREAFGLAAKGTSQNADPRYVHILRRFEPMAQNLNR